MGHRRIAYIHGEDDSEVTKQRLTSFYRTLEELGIEVPDEYVKSSEYLNSVKAEQFTDELLDMKDAPTCIFYPDDLSNTGGLNAVRKRGLKVPRDISTDDGWFGNRNDDKSSLGDWYAARTPASATMTFP
jgi:DNA-binding LacI/PurR family transcriptional regulator